MLTLKDIQIRDPYVYLEGDTYYMVGTTDQDCWKAPGVSFLCYQSRDLIHFEEPVTIFMPSEGFWGTHNFWAPELHAYNGAYYLFASFKAEGRKRASAILKADNPLGPFLPWGEEQVTPKEWQCLDGTLFVDTDGKPYVVFCHEWVEPGGGTICARPLKKDLSGPDGEAVTLFHASEAPWAMTMTHSSGIVGHVTDCPFLYRGRDRMFMLWSSFGEGGYAQGLCYSQSGTISGPFLQLPAPLYAGDGGHGMLFLDKVGRLFLSLHSPNKTPEERARFLPVRDDGERMVIDMKGEQK